MADQSPFAPMGNQPVMPEDMEPPKSFMQMLMPHVRAVGAGAVDPFGLAGKVATDHHLSRRLAEMRAESPFVADIASILAPGGVIGKMGGMTIREMALPLLGVAGNVATGMSQLPAGYSPHEQPKRPQAAYGRDKAW